MAKTSLSVDAANLTRRITRTPFPGSRKIYIDGSRPDIRVPFREVTLTDTSTSGYSSVVSIGATSSDPRTAALAANAPAAPARTATTASR